MRYVSALVMLALSSLAFSQTPQLKSGSTVYIEPMGGYETYIAAALVKKHVPLVVVTEKTKADLVIKSSLDHRSIESSAPLVAVNNTINNGTQPINPIAEGMQRKAEQGAEERRAMGETSANITVIDPQSSQVMFSYSADKMGTKQLQKTAEDCAKHLKDFIEKSEKPKK